MKDFQKFKNQLRNLYRLLLADLHLAIIPALLVFFIMVLMTIDAKVLQDTSAYDIKHLGISSNPSSYPVLAIKDQPYISAQSAIVIDDSSKVAVYEKNTNLRFPMASTTKVMTAIVGLEQFRSGDVLTVKSTYTQGATIGLEAREQVSFESLLYAMLLPSGNDAALTIADNYPGGQEAFVKRMNSKAYILGLKSTHFADPAGLYDEGNFTTVRDLAFLASFAMKDSEIAKIIATKAKVITNVDNSKQYTLHNLNKLLDVKGVTGVKTGFTQGAQGVLITAKQVELPVLGASSSGNYTSQESSRKFIFVVMRSQDRFADTEVLLSLVDRNIKIIDPNFLLR